MAASLGAPSGWITDSTKVDSWTTLPSAPRHWPEAFETVKPCGNRGVTESCTNFDQSWAVTGPRAHAVPKYNVSWTSSCSPGLQLECCGETHAASANDIAAAAKAGKAGKRSMAPTLRIRYATSNSPAAPMPPPMHMVVTTYLTPRRLPSMRACPTRRDPETP